MKHAERIKQLDRLAVWIGKVKRNCPELLTDEVRHEVRQAIQAFTLVWKEKSN